MTQPMTSTPNARHADDSPGCRGRQPRRAGAGAAAASPTRSPSDPMPSATTNARPRKIIAELRPAASLPVGVSRSTRLAGYPRAEERCSSSASELPSHPPPDHPDPDRQPGQQEAGCAESGESLPERRHLAGCRLEELAALPGHDESDHLPHRAAQRREEVAKRQAGHAEEPDQDSQRRDERHRWWSRRRIGPRVGESAAWIPAHAMSRPARPKLVMWWLMISVTSSTPA